MYYKILELIIIILFILVLVDVIKYRKLNPKKQTLFILSLVYAFILENINSFLTAGQVGNTLYNREFFVLWNVPLFVILFWAVMVYVSMHVSDLLKLRQIKKPFMDSLFVVLIYLTLNIVLVRHEVIAFVGISQTQGWFGVPVDNLIAIMFSTLTFSFLFRYFTKTRGEIINKTTRFEFFFLLPVFAYLSMLVFFSLSNMTSHYLQLSSGQESFILWMLVALFALIIEEHPEEEKAIFHSSHYTVFVMLFVRILLYTYVIWGIVLSDIYQEGFSVVIILILSLTAEILIYSSAFRRYNRQPKKTHLDEY